MAVERTRPRNEIQILSVDRLWREDLEAIAAACAEIGPIAISCNDTYRADDPGDFKALPENIEKLHIVAEDGQGHKISVELSKLFSRIELTEPTALTLGLANMIQRTTARPGRLFKRAGSRIIVALIRAALSAVALILCLVPWVSSMPISNNWIIKVFSIAGIILWIVIEAWHLLSYNGAGSMVGHLKIHNIYWADRPTSFWRRTQDDWTVQLLGGIALTILGFLLGKFLG
ncbi:hypothetical protein [Nonomuraea jabiensis]|uniref:hypothetical protein n=1 Tax=Nonomuraea jabiensis TaxID=882448 RepID=UPI003D75DCAE